MSSSDYFLDWSDELMSAPPIHMQVDDEQRAKLLDLLQRMLEPDPEHRITAAQV